MVLRTDVRNVKKANLRLLRLYGFYAMNKSHIIYTHNLLYICFLIHTFVYPTWFSSRKIYESINILVWMVYGVVGITQKLWNDYLEGGMVSLSLKCWFENLYNIHLFQVNNKVIQFPLFECLMCNKSLRFFVLRESQIRFC